MQPPTHARGIRPIFAWELVESLGAVRIKGSRVRQTLCLNALRSGDGTRSGVQRLCMSNKLCVKEPNQDIAASAGRDVVLCRQATPGASGTESSTRSRSGSATRNNHRNEYRGRTLPSGWPYTGQGARAPAATIPMPSRARAPHQD